MFPTGTLWIVTDFQVTYCEMLRIEDQLFGESKTPSVRWDKESEKEKKMMHLS